MIDWPIPFAPTSPMTPKDLALAYIERFCAGDVQALGELLCEKLRFTGPFLQVDSHAEYLASLADGPPEPAGYEILSVTEDGDEVSVFWEYIKADGRGVIAQWTRTEDGCIAETRLVFDVNDFS